NEGSDHAGQREEKELRCGTSDVALSRRSAVWICDGYGRRRLRRLGRPRSRRTARKRQVLGQEARRTRWDDEFPSHRWLQLHIGYTHADGSTQAALWSLGETDDELPDVEDFSPTGVNDDNIVVGTGTGERASDRTSYLYYDGEI